MKTEKIITIIGFSLILIYSLTRILEFYNINISVYGSYLVFYLFLLICYFVLQKDYPNIFV